MLVQGGHLPKNSGKRSRAPAASCTAPEVSADGEVSAESDAQPPGGDWTDDDLRLLADAMLDGADDATLAREFGRTRGAVRRLRAAFECARGNLVEDDIGPAVAWVPRLQRVLTPS